MAPAQPPEMIPRSLLFGNPERTNVQVSPDGRHLAWIAPVDGVLNLWVAPIDKLSVVLVAVFAAIFLGERLSAAGWAGVALIAAGAALVAWAG